MKKILTAIFAAALAGATWGATSVGTWSALRTAAISGGEIVLTGDIEVTEVYYAWEGLYIENSVELDLAGHTISVPAEAELSDPLFYVAEGGTLTIKGNGTIDASSYEGSDFAVVNNNFGGPLTIKSGVTIKANLDDSLYAYALDCEEGDTTIVEDGVVLDGAVLPDGFTFAADGKTVVGKHTVSGGNVVVEPAPTDPTDSVVAKIGDVEYTSLAAAISDVPANGTETTIVMQADTVLDATVVIPAGKKVILDLNGKAITVPNATPHIYAIRNNGTMTLTDSKGSGSISARGVYNGPDNTSAKMTVEGGTYYNLDSDGGAAIFNKAELTVNGGTFNGTAVCLNNSGSAATMIVNGATANGYTNYAVQNNGGTVTINDITVNGKFGAFGQWQGTSTTTINGGTFAIVDNTYAGYTHHCVYVGAGDLTINGGTFTNGDNQADSGLALCMLSSGTATITGGTFTNLAPDSGNETISLWGGSGTFAVSGGTFNRDVKVDYHVEGVTKTNNGNGTWTVQPPVPVVLPSVTNKVVSANLFGALTVNAGSATNAFVAVPFGAFDIGDVKIAAADVVQAATLSAGDKMYVWNGAEDTSQQYDVYEVKNGVWTVAKKVTVAANGAQSEGSTSPDSHLVDSGTGIFIERKDTSKPIYVYGQVLTNTVAETAFGAGLTLVSAPSTNAMAQINLNALAWTGVKPVTITTTTSGRKIVTSYANADFIYYRNTANRIVRLYYDGTKWGTVSGTWKDAGDEAKIPAGTAFWYMNNGSASVRWQ